MFLIYLPDVYGARQQEVARLRGTGSVQEVESCKIEFLGGTSEQ